MAILSRRKMAKLRALQSGVHERALSRNQALRIFVASRHATTVPAQRELWFEFSWADEEYRSAVRELAKFCQALMSREPVRPSAAGGTGYLRERIP